MKSQNDLIAMGCVAFATVVMLVLSLTVFRRQVTAPTPPTPVTTSDAPLPVAAPVMVASLPQGSSTSAGRGGFGGFSGGFPGAGGAPGAAGPGGMSKGKADFMSKMGGVPKLGGK